jgi:hypothetical protein
LVNLIIFNYTSMAGNGLANASVLAGVFPEALQSLREADPEVYAIIQDEAKRQWYDRASLWTA